MDLFNRDYDFKNYKRHQYLTNNKPKTVEDVQGWLKRGLKHHDWSTGPYVVGLSSAVYSDLVVDWCVTWLNSCKYVILLRFPVFVSQKTRYKGRWLHAVQDELGEPHCRRREITVTLKDQ